MSDTRLRAADLADEFRSISSDKRMEYVPAQAVHLLFAADMLDENERLREQIHWLKQGDILHVLTDQEYIDQCERERLMQVSIDALDKENAKLRKLVVALYHIHFGTEEESWDAWEDFCPCSICEERHGGEAPCAYTSKDLSDECCEPTTKEIVIDRMRELGVEV